MTIFSWSLYIDITVLSYLCIKIVIIISNLIIVFINKLFMSNITEKRERRREKKFLKHQRLIYINFRRNKNTSSNE